MSTSCLSIPVSSRGRILRFGIYSNAKSISFFHFKDDDPEKRFYSAVLEFSNPFIVSDDQPVAEGFRWLFAIMLEIAKKSKPITVKIGAKEYVVQAVYKDASISVYHIEIDNRPYIAKTCSKNDTPTKMLINRETLACQLWHCQNFEFSREPLTISGRKDERSTLANLCHVHHISPYA